MRSARRQSSPSLVAVRPSEDESRSDARLLDRYHDEMHEALLEWFALRSATARASHPENSAIDAAEGRLLDRYGRYRKQLTDVVRRDIELEERRRRR